MSDRRTRTEQPGGVPCGGYVVRDPKVIALMRLVVRCHGCDRLRVKYPDGRDAMCPWCGSNSSTFVETERV